jgi:uncharacterized membrane protein
MSGTKTIARTRRLAVGATLVLGLCAAVDRAAGQCQEPRLTAPDGQVDDWFGAAVEVDGDMVVVGARFDDDLGTDAGAAYLYRLEPGAPGEPAAWEQVAKLTASDGGWTDAFGFAVAISGDHVAVGAPNDDDACPGDPFCNSGAVYIFERNAGGPDAWGEIAKIVPADTSAHDLFGRAVALDGDVLVVGGVQPAAATTEPGSTHVFRRTGGATWDEITQLTPPDGIAGDAFGYAVAVEGDLVVVAARHHDDGGADSGAAYVYEQAALDDWSFRAKLVASDPTTEDEFGHDVAVSGARVLVGSRYSDLPGALQAGAAYLFERDAGGADQWGQVAKLTAPTPEASGWYGFSVGLQDDLAFVGAPASDVAAPDGGAVFVHERDASGAGAWGRSAELTAADVEAGDVYGIAVAAAPSATIVGARGEDSDAGAAYVVRPDGADCNTDGFCDDVQIAADPALDCNDNGVLDACDLGDAVSRDCNGNGMPDECDIALDPCVDLDDNGIPDACEEAGRMYEVILLDTVDAVENRALAVSEDFDLAVAGYQTLAGGERHAFFWTEATGTIDVHPAAHDESVATGVNSGEVTGWVVDPPPFDRRPFIWRKAPFPPDPAFELIPISGPLTGSATAMNEATFVVGAVGTEAQPLGRFWTPDLDNPGSWIEQTLPTPPASFIEPLAINKPGGCIFLPECDGPQIASRIVGRDASLGSALMWHQPLADAIWEVVDLGTLPGGGDAEARGLTPGQGVTPTLTFVAGASGTATGSRHAAVWRVETVVLPDTFEVTTYDLGALGGARRDSALLHMIDTTGVGWSQTVTGDRHAVVADSTDPFGTPDTWTLRDLNHFLPPEVELKLVEATAVGAHGTIVGWGLLDGVERAFLLRPGPGFCPADLDDDGVVGFSDLLLVLAKWGVLPGGPGSDRADVVCDGVVGFNDLLAVLSTWGACP